MYENMYATYVRGDCLKFVFISNTLSRPINFTKKQRMCDISAEPKIDLIIILPVEQSIFFEVFFEAYTVLEWACSYIFYLIFVHT